MGVTNRVALTRLQNGEETNDITLTPPGESLVLRLTTTALNGNPSQASMHIRDSQGRQVGKVICQDGENKRLELQPLPAGDLFMRVECNLGSVDVQVDELSDLDAVLPDGDGQLETDDIPDSAVTTVKLNDAAVTTQKMGAAAATLPKVSFAGLKVLRFDGINGAGAVTLTGAAVGDRVVAILGTVVTSGVSIVGGADFESVISVVDQIQQAATGDLSDNDYWVLLAPTPA